MHSRAYLLLKRDLVNLQRFPLEGVTAGPSSDLNMLQWQARLHGLSDTPWEGGVFHLRLQFSADFNSAPPLVQFMTIPFHPNIDPVSGAPHCHLLSAGWSEAISVPVLLIALQALLSNPELVSAYIVNMSASQLFHKAPHAYHQMAMDCATASLRVDAGLAPYEEEEDVTTTTTSPAPSPLPSRLPSVQPQPQSVSFDDYLNLWRGIATSRLPVPQQSSSGKADRVWSSALRFRGASREKNLQHKLQQHQLIQHGQGATGTEGHSQLLLSVARQRRMEQLRHVYAVRVGERGKEDGEVDQLLQWTRSLDSAVLTTPQPLTTPL